MERAEGREGELWIACDVVGMDVWRAQVQAVGCNVLQGSSLGKLRSRAMVKHFKTIFRQYYSLLNRGSESALICIQ